jgi:hypothetical protein
VEGEYHITQYPQGERVAAADAFFLYAESPAAVQQVGGVVMLDATGGPPERAAVVEVLRDRLDQLPRFRQRLSVASRWRRPRWVDAPEPDWAWHVPLRRLPQPGGRRALHQLVAELHVTPLPRDRPLWRLVLVPEVDDGVAAAVLVMHHVIADGLGVIRQALRLLDPVAAGDPPAVAGGGARRPGSPALAVVAGIAQLASDGWVRRRLPTSRGPRRRYGTASVPLAELRAVARRHRVRVTDVLLSAVAGALRRLRPDLAADRRYARLRTLVPLMVRDQASPAEGNLTGAVMLDLPLGAMPEVQRLAAVARASGRRRRGTQAVASRFVIQAVGRLPPPVHAWFARTVYRGRFFQIIVSNMPGPDTALSLAGKPLLGGYPVVPLAAQSPLAIGVLGWRGTLHIGICADPVLLEDAEAFGPAIRTVLDELAT